LAAPDRLPSNQLPALSLLRCFKNPSKVRRKFLGRRVGDEMKTVKVLLIELF